MLKNKIKIILKFICIFYLITAPLFALNIDKLSEKDIQTVKNFLKTTEPMIQEKTQFGSLALLTFDELWSPLDKKSKKLAKKLLKIKPKSLKVKTPFHGINNINKNDVEILSKFLVGKDETKKEICEQYLPKNVAKKYFEMIEAMKADIGKTLYVESGYRSDAYQLYLFIFYLSNHDYSIRETAKFVALPGCSEHGDFFGYQALDFINEDGINGDGNPEQFEALEQYSWLVKNAGNYGFVLSYPRDQKTGISFEPWHWHYDIRLVNQDDNN